MQGLSEEANPDLSNIDFSDIMALEMVVRKIVSDAGIGEHCAVIGGSEENRVVVVKCGKFSWGPDCTAATLRYVDGPVLCSVRHLNGAVECTLHLCARKKLSPESYEELVHCMEDSGFHVTVEA